MPAPSPQPRPPLPRPNDTATLWYLHDDVADRDNRASPTQPAVPTAGLLSQRIAIHLSILSFFSFFLEETRPQVETEEMPLPQPPEGAYQKRRFSKNDWKRPRLENCQGLLWRKENATLPFLSPFIF